MLFWSRGGRAAVWMIFAVVVLVVFVAPIATVVLAGFAGSWTGPLPSHLGLTHMGDALSGENVASLSVYSTPPTNSCFMPARLVFHNRLVWWAK